MRETNEPRAKVVSSCKVRAGAKKEATKLNIRCNWRDTVTYADGRVERTEWRSNQVQNLAAVMVAALLRRADEDPSFTPYAGFTYFAVGSGAVGWDSVPPTIPRTDTTLTAEYFRKAIDATDMVFIDPAEDPGESLPQVTPTRAFRLSVLLGPSEANGAMREFSVFGGQATGAADSGDIYNHVVHDLFNKTDQMSIDRTLEFEIVEPT